VDLPFPILSDQATTSDRFVMLAVLFLCLFIVAMIVAYLQRRVQRRGQLAGEWATVDTIMQEKELSPDEREAVRRMVRQWSPQDPVRAVTVRHQFDRCVESEMDDLLARGGKRFAETGATLRDIRGRLGLDYIPHGQRIQSTREVYIGQIMWLSRPTEDKDAGAWIRTKVVAVDEAFFFVAPTDDPPPKTSFHVDEAVKCRMWRDEDARYIFTAAFARGEDKPPSWLFRHANRLERLQSRAYYRVRVDQSADVGIIDAPKDGSEEGLDERPVVTRLRARLTSLSGGGVALETQQAVPKQVYLRVTIDLPEGEPADVIARIVTAASTSAGHYLVRATFVAVDDEARDAITRYVMMRQQQFMHGEGD
jgi:c-di-GMP-binding flagellar brake protein YcgR